MTERCELELPDGTRLFVEVSDRRNAPLTVIFLHGWCLDRRTWKHQYKSVKNARIVSYDARGHGRSSPLHLKTATLPQLGEDLAEVIRRHAPRGRIVLAGHSLGGMTIMEYAAAHPEEFKARVAGLLLVSTTAEGSTRTCYGLPTALTPLLRLAEETGAGVLARLGAVNAHRPLIPALQPAVRWLLFGDEYDPADLRTTMSAVRRASLRAIGGFRPSVGAQRQLETVTGMAGIPAAVLVGDRDRLTPPACAESIAEALPGTELTVCPGAGHMLMMERPGEVSGALASVLKSALRDGERATWGKAA